MVQNCLKEELKHYIIQEVKFFCHWRQFDPSIVFVSRYDHYMSLFHLIFSHSRRWIFLQGQDMVSKFCTLPQNQKKVNFLLNILFSSHVIVLGKRFFAPRKAKKNSKRINQDKAPKYLIALFLVHLVFTLNPSAISLNC